MARGVGRGADEGDDIGRFLEDAFDIKIEELPPGEASLFGPLGRLRTFAGAVMG